MSGKKWLTRITLIVTALSFVGIILSRNSNKLCYDLLLAMFGSALLGLIMSVTEYFVERRRAMETFWQASFRATNELRKAEPIQCDIPKDLCIQCIAEKINNQKFDEYGKETAAFLGITRGDIKAKEYADWILENEPTSFSEEDDIDAILLNVAHERIENEYKKFIKLLDNIIMISKIDLSEVSNAYGNLDFLAGGNRRIRHIAYNEIYNKLRETLNKVRSEAYHFNLWKEGKGNLVICVSKIYQLYDLLFKETYKTNDGFETKLVYAQVADEIMISLEDFRTHIYGKKAREEYEPTAIIGQMISFTDRDNE